VQRAAPLEVMLKNIISNGAWQPPMRRRIQIGVYISAVPLDEAGRGLGRLKERFTKKWAIRFRLSRLIAGSTSSAAPRPPGRRG
jgi:hypothetical protein